MDILVKTVYGQFPIYRLNPDRVIIDYSGTKIALQFTAVEIVEIHNAIHTKQEALTIAKDFGIPHSKAIQKTQEDLEYLQNYCKANNINY